MKLTRKSIGRIAASFVATAMLATMAIVPASAANPEDIDTVTIKKAITASENVKVPNTSFTFTVDEGTGVDATEDSPAIYPGVENAVYFDGAANTITFSPADAVFTKETQLSVDTSMFTAPGIYRYVVEETAGSYDGMTYDTNKHTLDVYVTNGADGSYDFAYIFDGKAYGDAEGKTDGTITNTYTTHKVTVGKTVEGNQGNTDKDFSFTVTVSGADGEQYTLIKENDTEHPITLTSETPQSVSLKDGQTFVIYGLSENDTYTVVEDNYSSEGYVTSYDSAYAEGDKRTDDDVQSGNSISSVTIGNDDDSVMFYNYKDASTPTGIMMDIAPYAVLVVIAAAGCFIFLRKRHAKED